MFDIFNLSDPVTLATLVAAIEEERDGSLEITIDSPDQIDGIVALVEERYGPEHARAVRKALEEHFGLA